MSKTKVTIKAGSFGYDDNTYGNKHTFSIKKNLIFFEERSSAPLSYKLHRCSHEDLEEWFMECRGSELGCALVVYGNTIVGYTYMS